jgi:hypothetical protein
MFAGIDVGHVIDQGQVHEVAAIDTSWVRINIRLDQWTSLDDSWFAAYDQAIDAYIARGFEVYALINDEAVPDGAGYAETATAIIDHFKNRIRVFELVNEPNDWAGGSSARIPPAAFAAMVADTYHAVKHGDRCSDVTLVSGPLFSFDDNASADYLDQVYAAWGALPYPLDGIGYHMYVAQGLDSSDADVRTQMTANLSALWSVIAAHGDTDKRIWVSEYGWEAGVVGADVQAARMQAGYDAMRDFGKVEGAIYFNYRDFPGASYGVVDDAGAPRPAAAMLASFPANARAAAIDHVAAPVLAPGEVGEVVVTLTNRGSTTWSGGVRLGAGPGCPDAAAANAIAWEPADGYANGITDARVFLPHDVAPGESIDVHVPVRAPDAPGTYTFAARMVDEGVAWFGATATATVTVAARPGGSPGDGGADPATSSGCAAGGSASLWILAGLACRRSRRSSRKPTPAVPGR